VIIKILRDAAFCYHKCTKKTLYLLNARQMTHDSRPVRDTVCERNAPKTCDTALNDWHQSQRNVERNTRIVSATKQGHKTIKQGHRVVAKMKKNIGNSANVTYWPQMVELHMW